MIDWIIGKNLPLPIFCNLSFIKVFTLSEFHTIPYTPKLSSGKTFVVVHEIHHSLENFCGASGRGHRVQYTASESRGKLS